MYDYVIMCFFCSDVILKQLDQYTRVLRETSSLSGNFAVPVRLHCLLGNLIVQSLHHRDIVQSELASQFITL